MSTIVSDVTVTDADGNTTQTITYDDGGVYRLELVGGSAGQANKAILVSKARAALAVNATFLALVAPTNAQTLAQVQALTKECNGIIRLLINALDATTGT